MWQRSEGLSITDRSDRLNKFLIRENYFIASGDAMMMMEETFRTVTM